VKLATHLYLVPRSRICGTVPPLSHYSFMAWFSVKKEANGRIYLSEEGMQEVTAP
jgi:hypothetical protein